jgi:hypothetical protein
MLYISDIVSSNQTAPISFTNEMSGWLDNMSDWLDCFGMMSYISYFYGRVALLLSPSVHRYRSYLYSRYWLSAKIGPFSFDARGALFSILCFFTLALKIWSFFFTNNIYVYAFIEEDIMVQAQLAGTCRPHALAIAKARTSSFGREIST